MQIKEVKVKFEENGKEYSFDAAGVYVNIGDKVIVDTVRGNELGEICSRVQFKEVGEPLKKVIRIASEEDIKQKQENEKKEEDIKNECQEMADGFRLDMKVVKTELAFDRSKVIIYFTADDRVDFRELVKTLAGKLKMRIELKQIDAREETKLLGGLGPCGKECCCSQFLSEPAHSTIKMAKVQGLSLNPNNISGLCGKLKCCLAYENEHYSEAFKQMPKVNTEINTPDGKGLVVYNNILKKIVTVKFINPDSSQTMREYPLENLEKFDGSKND